MIKYKNSVLRKDSRQMRNDKQKLALLKQGMLIESRKQRNKAWFYHLIKSNKDVLEEKKRYYVDNFTVHGLTKIFTSKGFESFFWLFVVLCGTLFTGLIVHGLIDKYLRFEVLTELAFETTRHNVFPSLTFCERNRLMQAYFQYCEADDGSFDQDLPCDIQTTKLLKEKRDHHDKEHKIQSKEKQFWSNGLFNITKCVSIGRKQCLYSMKFKSSEHLDDTCFTWNPDGDFHDIYGGVDITFTFKHHDVYRDLEVIVISHDHEIKELDITNRVIIEPYKKYNIRIDKTLLKRLPDPFPTKCTTKKNGDIFPGKYSRRGCIESNHFIDMYKRCGDTFDYVRQYIPEDIKVKYKQNLSITAAKQCIYQAVTSETKGVPNCSFPCTELDFAISSTFYKRNIPQDGPPVYRVSILLKRVDLYHVIVEKSFFHWDQLACQVGGFLAVVTGASILSFIEILVYLTISLVQKVK